MGDSQSVEPGKKAEKILLEHGYNVRRLSSVGMGPYDHVRMPVLWNRYISCVRTFKPDLIVLIFGTNDAPTHNLDTSLEKLKSSVKPPVILTGPPQYPSSERQAIGLDVKRRYQSAFGEDYLDSYPHTSTDLVRDRLGLHFTSVSASAWGEAIAKEVLRRTAT